MRNSESHIFSSFDGFIRSLRDLQMALRIKFQKFTTNLGHIIPIYSPKLPLGQPLAVVGKLMKSVNFVNP